MSTQSDNGCIFLVDTSDYINEQEQKRTRCSYRVLPSGGVDLNVTLRMFLVNFGLLCHVFG